jgi:hypothetical protein
VTTSGELQISTIFIVVAVLVLVQGCASLSGEKCEVADWYAIGYEDGLQGRPALRIADHRKACAKYGVTLDLERYADGRDAGLAVYCRPRNGYRIGRQGVSYAGVCPMESEPAFLDAYYIGRELFSLESRLGQLDQEIAARQSELELLRQDIAALEAELVMAGSPRNVRQALLEELRTLEKEALAAEQALVAADEERIHQQAQLADLKSQSENW